MGVFHNLYVCFLEVVVFKIYTHHQCLRMDFVFSDMILIKTVVVGLVMFMYLLEIQKLHVRA